MTVRELMDALRGADPESIVLFLEAYADVGESDEVSHLLIPELAWVHETGAFFGERYEFRLPKSERGEVEAGRMDVVQRLERVVVLSNGPTNLRYLVDE
ncbi:hypothetical protein AWB78_02396 [Caballeronia calidae]|uniref:Uncharacterized protein n=1 Tax=Caballeronia calidae TaxID=1777139 RepID=A0A158B860_9BURK|nr:hypothetical protein [Caballeronia calidae]SAK66285.1 hypothetical protein AWB78_02396 [Caballeronia calidae]